MLETYRGIPHLVDTWLVLTGTALPIAVSAVRRRGEAVVPRLASLLLPAAFALVLAATLSPTSNRLAAIGSCGTQLTTTGGLTSVQGLLNVVLFVPAAGVLTLTSGRPADGIATGIGLSASVEAIQALVPQLGRSCQLHDLIANTAGAFVGVAIAAGLQAVARRRTLSSPVMEVEHGALAVARGRRIARHRRPDVLRPARRAIRQAETGVVLVPRAIPARSSLPAEGSRRARPLARLR